MKNILRAILMAVVLAASMTSYADFAAHEKPDSSWVVAPRKKTLCYHKSNNKMIAFSINWDTSIVMVNGIRTKINGMISNGSGITTSRFTTKSGTQARFRIAHFPGYPVIFEMMVADPYYTYADGYGDNRILESVFVRCIHSFVVPFQEYKYREQD